MIAIISDIHGNYPALQAVLADIDKMGCRSVLSLGDVAGYYCMINECIVELKNRGIINIMGNHDDYLVNNMCCPRSTAANQCMDYQRKIITTDNFRWLQTSVPSIRLDDLSLVHGGWVDGLDEYLQQIPIDYFELLPGKYFFSGHTHVQAAIEFNDKTYCNPGSVGQPRDGDRRAAYAIFNQGMIELRRVEYDITQIAEAMTEANFSSYFFENLQQGTQIGGKISTIQQVRS
jgi:predicted phosphodiesterase